MEFNNNKYKSLLIKLLLKLFAFIAIILLFINLLFLIFDEKESLDISYNYQIKSICQHVANFNHKDPPINKISYIDSLSKENQLTDNLFIRNYRVLQSRISSKIENYIRKRYLDKLLDNYKENYINETKIEKPNFGILPYHALFKLEKENTNLPYPKPDLEVYASKNEWVSFQIILTPFEESINSLELVINNLPKEITKIQCFEGEYIYCKEPQYIPEKTGWQPDPLIPVDCEVSKSSIIIKSDNIKINKNESKSIWVNFLISDSIKSDKYKLKIDARVNNKSEYQNSKANLNIVDYSLPKTMKLKTAFRFDPNIYASYYNISTTDITDEKRKKIFKFYLDYRLNPCNLYDHGFPRIDEWEWCIERGANCFNVKYFSGYENGLTNRINEEKSIYKNLINQIKERNLEKYAYFFGYDEILPKDYKWLNKFDSLFNEINTSIPWVCTSIYNKKIDNAVDIWCPQLNNYRLENIDSARINNEEIWWYVCNYPSKPYPNLFTDYSAIDPRILLWMTSKNNISGLLYWETIQWQSNYLYETQKNKKHIANTIRIHEDKHNLNKLKQGKRWPEVPWNSFSYYRYNGDGMLIYPWKNGELIPSIRLVNLRDGIEDYELLHQLKELKNKFKKLGDIENVNYVNKVLKNAYSLVEKTNEYNTNPDDLLKAKKEILKTLEKYNVK